MITVVSGRLGSGKSYDMTRMICSHVRRGGIVATNMALHESAISAFVGRKLSSMQFLRVSSSDRPDMIPRGDFRGTGSRRVLVVLDEALNWFESRGGASDDRKLSWGRWLRQSDKLGQDVYFIAQNFDRAAKWIRELAQINREVIRVRDLRILHFLPVWVLIPNGKNLYFVKSYDVRAQSVLSSELHFYNSRIYACYSTSELYDFVASSNAYSSFSVAPPFVLESPVFSLCLIISFVSLALAVSGWFGWCPL